MSAGIERVVNSTTGLIETKVNSSVSGITGNINRSMNTVESGVNNIIGSTNSVIGGAETAVNSVTGNINKAMNGVEKGVNVLSTGVASGINKVITPVNHVVTAVRKLRGVDMGINKGFVNWNISPFTSLPNPETIKSFKGGKLDNPDIPKEKFPRIKTSLDIPDVRFDGIEIKDIDIPTVNIRAPKDIAKIDSPDIDIPGVEIPIPRDLDPDDIDFPTIPGFGFISDKVADIKASIRSIFETAMAPLYDGVATLIALVGNIISSAVHFFENYLSWTAIKQRVSQLITLGGNGISLLKDMFMNEIVPGFIRLILSMKDPILAFVKTVSEHVWKFMKKVGTNVGSIFNETYRVITKVTGVVAKGVFSTGLFIVGTTVEKCTGFLPVSLSIKMLLILATLVWMIAGQFAKNANDIVKLATGAVRAAVVAITDLDSSIDSYLGFGKGASVQSVASSFIF